MRNVTHQAAWVLLVSALLASATAHSHEYRKKSLERTRLYIITPKPGATVESPVTFRFGLAGMGFAPAGMAKVQSGHRHLLIDTDASELDFGKPLPATDWIRHFGNDQTEAVLELAPGMHTLQLVLGDENHVPFDPPLLSGKVSITVK